MTEYLIASNSDREEIIDFINYVFSYSHRPHDFKTLCPKSYADDAIDMGAYHYIVKVDGRIKGCIANRVIDVNYNGKILKYGLIGNVSVHPYSRGAGYMKGLMKMAIEHSREIGVDMLVLGGQRQRYAYFGFEDAGANMQYEITDANIRHAFKDVDSDSITFKPYEEASDDEIDYTMKLYESRQCFAVRDKREIQNIMKSWTNKSYMIYKNGTLIGHMYGKLSEVVLKDEADYAAVLKSVFVSENLKTHILKVSPFMHERCNFLSDICENTSICTTEQISVLNWEKVIDTLLSFKSTYTQLLDGEAVISVDGECLRIKVCDNEVSVQKADSADAAAFEHNKLINMFFDLKTIFYGNAMLKNWAPLPFIVDGPDTY